MKLSKIILESKANNFHLMRLIAACVVIYGHSQAITSHGPNDFFLDYFGFRFAGGVAVAFFFVISGFLVTASAFRNSLYKYAISRVLRIYPALVVCLLISVLIVGPILTTSNNYWSFDTAHYFFINLSGFHTDYFLPGVFDSNPAKGFNGVLWTIALELKLYLFTSILIVFPLFKKRRYFNFLFFSFLIFGYITHFYSEIFNPDHIEFVVLYLLGAFVYVNKDEIEINSPIMLLLLIIGVILHKQDKFIYIYPILVTYIVFMIAYVPKFKFLELYKNDYSYGVYLYGWIVQQVIFSNFKDINNLTLSLASILISFLLGIISYHFVEKIFLKMKVHNAKK